MPDVFSQISMQNVMCQIKLNETSFLDLIMRK